MKKSHFLAARVYTSGQKGEGAKGCMELGREVEGRGRQPQAWREEGGKADRGSEGQRNEAVSQTVQSPDNQLLK